jgi:hypothetical protein
MRRLLLIASMLLLTVAFVSAQSSDITNSQTSLPAPANAKQDAVQGCLFATGGIYNVPDSSGGLWQLLGSPNQLKNDVGHTVAMTGTGSNAAVLTGNPQEYIDVDMVSINDFQVSSIKQISGTCSEQSKRAEQIGMHFEKRNS